MRNLNGKRVLITGGANGIGRAIALELAQHGADLFLVDRDEAGLQAAVHACQVGNNEVIGQYCDISKPTELAAVVDNVLTRWGTLDILVNNAAVCFYGPTTDMQASQWDDVLGVNLLAPAQLTRALLPHLLSRREAHILNVASMYGLIATNRCAVYHLTKFGLVCFSEALRAEYGRQGLGVTALCPGFVKTGLFHSVPNENRKRSARVPPAWLCVSAEKVARAGVRAILRDKRLVLVSPLAHVLYHTRRIAPGLFDALYHFGRRRKPRVGDDICELPAPRDDQQEVSRRVA